MSKIYAVKGADIKELFESWSECESYIKGKKNIKQKSFKNKEEALLFLETDDLISAEQESVNEYEIIELEDNEYIAYTDGSYDKNMNIASYGIVMLSNNCEEYISGFVDEKFGSANITGETIGAIEAIKYAIKKNAKKIKLYCDYEGLSKWFSSEWKIKAGVSMDYMNKLDELRDNIDIEIEWVKGHAGDKYNGIADKLAGNEINSLKPSEEDEWGFKSYKFTNTQLEESLSRVKDFYSDFIYRPIISKNMIQYRCSFNGESTVIIKYNFDYGNKLLIPKNNNERIFSFLISFLNDYVKINNIVPLLNANLKNHFSTEDIRNKLYEIAPNLNGEKINPSVYRLLVQSIYNFMNDFEDIEDSSYITTPALRALEGQLKILFKQKLNIIINNNGFGYFDKNQLGFFALQTSYTLNLPPSEVDMFNDCYNQYSLIRNSLLHFGDIDIDDTRFLNTEDSKATIKQTIEIINSCY